MIITSRAKMVWLLIFLGIALLLIGIPTVAAVLVVGFISFCNTFSLAAALLFGDNTENLSWAFFASTIPYLLFVAFFTYVLLDTNNCRERGQAVSSLVIMLFAPVLTALLWVTLFAGLVIGTMGLVAFGVLWVFERLSREIWQYFRPVLQVNEVPEGGIEAGYES